MQAPPRAKAVPLNTFLMVEPLEIDAEDLWRVLTSDHVMRQLHGARHSYGGGLWKVEPRELANVRIRI
jgi:hypothetical protein